MLVVLFSGFARLLDSGGLVVSCIKGLGCVSGWRSLAVATLAALAAWWLSPRLWMMSGALMPSGLIPRAAVALTFVIMGRRSI